MEYKTIQELWLTVGGAAAVLIVFLGLFIYMIKTNNKMMAKQNEDTLEQIKEIVKGVIVLKDNDSDFKLLMENMIETVKELSTTNRIVADTVGKLDFYNKDLHKKVEKHDEKAEKILEELRKR